MCVVLGGGGVTGAISRFCQRMSCGLGYYREPEDGHHQWPKHVVVPNVVNN